MMFAAIALAGLATAVALLLSVLLWQSMKGRERDRRGHDRRVDDLLNRLAHAHGEPWAPAPVEETHDEGPPARVLDLVDVDQELSQ